MVKAKEKEGTLHKDWREAVEAEVQLILNLLKLRQDQTPIQSLVQRYNIAASYITRHVTRIPLHFLTKHAVELQDAAKHMGMTASDLVITAVRDFMKRQKLQSVPFEGSRATQAFEDTLTSDVTVALAEGYGDEPEYHE